MPGRARRLAWLAVAAAGVLIGAGLFTFQYAAGLSYLSNDPAACMNCHVMREQYDSWVKGSHHAVATCNDCHVPHTFPAKYLAKARNGWNHSRKFTLQNFDEPIRITRANRRALQQNCIQCHAIAVSEIVSHQDAAAGNARCTDCHRSVGHMALD